MPHARGPALLDAGRQRAAAIIQRAWSAGRQHAPRRRRQAACNTARQHQWRGAARARGAYAATAATHPTASCRRWLRRHRPQQLRQVCGSSVGVQELLLQLPACGSWRCVAASTKRRPATVGAGHQRLERRPWQCARCCCWRPRLCTALQAPTQHTSMSACNGSTHVAMLHAAVHSLTHLLAGRQHHLGLRHSEQAPVSRPRRSSGFKRLHR